MSFSFWSFSGLPQLTPLASWPGLIWLIGYLAVLAFALSRNWQPILRYQSRSWLWLALACLAAAVLSGTATVRGAAAANIDSQGAALAPILFRHWLLFPC